MFLGCREIKIVGNKPIRVTRGHFLKNISNWGPEYEIRWDVKLDETFENSYTNYHSLFRFTSEVDAQSNYGSLIPSVTTEKRLSTKNSVLMRIMQSYWIHNVNYYVPNNWNNNNNYNLENSKWYSVAISHHPHVIMEIVKLLALALTNLVLDLASLVANLAKPSLG